MRLFLAVVQAAYGSLNTYTLTSSPWAVALLAEPRPGAAWARARISPRTFLIAVLPEVVQHGEFGAIAEVLRPDASRPCCSALGIFLATGVILVLGPGAAQMRDRRWSDC